jgi:hypothetical protein
MASHIIDGKAAAAALRTVIAQDVAKLATRGQAGACGRPGRR